MTSSHCDRAAVTQLWNCLWGSVRWDGWTIIEQLRSGWHVTYPTATPVRKSRMASRSVPGGAFKGLARVGIWPAGMSRTRVG